MDGIEKKTIEKEKDNVRYGLGYWQKTNNGGHKEKNKQTNESTIILLAESSRNDEWYKVENYLELNWKGMKRVESYVCNCTQMRPVWGLMNMIYYPNNGLDEDGKLIAKFVFVENRIAPWRTWI